MVSSLNTPMRVIFTITFFLILGKGNGQSLRFSEDVTKDSFFIHVVNEFYSPAYLRFDPKEALKELMRIPEEIVIQANDSLSNVVALSRNVDPESDTVNWKKYFDVSASLGDPYHSVHNDSFTYTLPFPKGKSYSIMQTWNGRFSHRSVESRYAIDFKMPIGDTICAARGGIVARIEKDFTENGGRSFRNKANEIVILHDDGTLGFYVHLKHMGVLVAPGDTVLTGQPIGLSGNTGFSTKPHLHFVVREAPKTAVPIYFKGYPGQKLRRKKRYMNRF